MKRSAGIGPLARWGWLATTFAMGAALIGTSVASYRGASEAQATLSRGLADLFRAAVRQHLREAGEGGDWQRALAEALEESRAAGLRYVALYDPSGERRAAAGTPVDVAAAARVRRGESFTLTTSEVGSRVRMLWDPPAPPAGTALAPGAPARPPALLIEYEPVAAQRLALQAGRTVALGSVAAVALMLAAIGFWRLSQRYQLAERRLEEQRRLGVLGEMSAVMAHEIRNPLASLKGHAQLLAERLAGGSEERRKADRVVADATRLERLTQDLLDFARSGPLLLGLADPAELLRAVAGELGNGRVAVDAAAAPAAWRLDRRRMEQVLANLIDNALRSAAPESPVEVSAAERGGRLVFTVRDHGEGLPAGEEERIFEPFFTTRTTGTGLGLAVARRIVEMHGGTLTAADHPQGGALFEVSLPRG